MAVEIRLDFPDGDGVSLADFGSVRFVADFSSSKEPSYFIELIFKDKASIVKLQDLTERNSFKKLKLYFGGDLVLTPVSTRVVKNGKMFVKFPDRAKFEESYKKYLNLSE